MREELAQLEQALNALNEVIAVRTEYVSLLGRLGSTKRQLTALDALLVAQSRLQIRIEEIQAALACGPNRR